MANLRRRIDQLEKKLGPRLCPGTTQDDEDALQLYGMHFYLNGTVHPDGHDLMETPIGIRGRDLYRQKYGPITPLYLCPGWSATTSASREFRHCFHREPIVGDLLRWAHVRAVRGPEMNEIIFGDMISAWERQIPQLPCPLKFEQGSLLKRQRNGDWQEDVAVSWMAHWWGVECDALGRPQDWAYGRTPPMWEEPDPNPLGRMPSIRAVVFQGIVDGKHRCREATAEERERPETNELIRSFWCTEPEGPPPTGRIWVRDKRSGFYGSIPVEHVAEATEGVDAEYVRWENNVAILGR